jgi:hypothetical protein
VKLALKNELEKTIEALYYLTSDIKALSGLQALAGCPEYPLVCEFQAIRRRVNTLAGDVCRAKVHLENTITSSNLLRNTEQRIPTPTNLT